MESAWLSIARGGAAELQAAVIVAPVNRNIIRWEMAKLLTLFFFIGRGLTIVVVGCDIIRSLAHRHAVFFCSPAAQVNHLAAFGAGRLPVVVFPVCFSTALRASSNFRVTHQSPENNRG